MRMLARASLMLDAKFAAGLDIFTVSEEDSSGTFLTIIFMYI